jgi:hypothetical protein
MSIKSDGKTQMGLGKEKKIKCTDAKQHIFRTPFAHATIILTVNSTKT